MYLPVLTEREPVLATTPSPASTASRVSSSGGRFLRTAPGAIPNSRSCAASRPLHAMLLSLKRVPPPSAPPRQP